LLLLVQGVMYNMYMNFLDRLALAHTRHEGFYPGSVSFRHSNPGNLRYRPYHKGYGGKPGAHNFVIFPSYEIGFRALKDDIKAKICGNSAHIDYSKNPTFLDYIKVYAPSDDGNNPNGYCQSLIRQLPEWHLYPDMLLTDMAKLVLETPLETPQTVESDNLAQRQIKTLRRAYKRAVRWGMLSLANRLAKEEDRLLNRIK